jgi:hypothetical protein
MIVGAGGRAGKIATLCVCSQRLTLPTNPAEPETISACQQPVAAPWSTEGYPP